MCGVGGWAEAGTPCREGETRREDGREGNGHFLEAGREKKAESREQERRWEQAGD